jgi:hypothetical protein
MARSRLRLHGAQDKQLDQCRRRIHATALQTAVTAQKSVLNEQAIDQAMDAPWLNPTAKRSPWSMHNSALVSSRICWKNLFHRRVVFAYPRSSLSGAMNMVVLLASLAVDTSATPFATSTFLHPWLTSTSSREQQHQLHSVNNNNTTRARNHPVHVCGFSARASRLPQPCRTWW